MSELAAAAAVNGRASRASRASTRAGSQYSSRRSEQLRRRAAHLQQNGQDSSDQQQHQQQTTGDESSWETDREPGGSNSTSGLLAGRRPHQSMTGMNSQQQRHNSQHRLRPGSSVRSGDNENWTDHDMDIYMAHNTMRNDLVRL